MAEICVDLRDFDDGDIVDAAVDILKGTNPKWAAARQEISDNPLMDAMTYEDGGPPPPSTAASIHSVEALRTKRGGFYPQFSEDPKFRRARGECDSTGQSS